MFSYYFWKFSFIWSKYKHSWKISYLKTKAKNNNEVQLHIYFQLISLKHLKDSFFRHFYLPNNTNQIYCKHHQPFLRTQGGHGSKEIRTKSLSLRARSEEPVMADEQIGGSKNNKEYSCKLWDKGSDFKETKL